MNIIITSDNLRHSFAINLHSWRAPAALLVAAAIAFFVIYRSALGLAENWAASGDERVRWLVEEIRERTDAERVELWNDTVARLEQDVTDLRVKLWRLTSLGNTIAERMGMGSEITVELQQTPQDEGKLSDIDNPDLRVSELDSRLIGLSEQVDSELLRISQIGASTSHASMQSATVPIQEPIEGRYWRTSGYGMRKDPFTGRRAFHAGYDYAARTGTPVLAGADGIVTHVGRLGNYGKTVEIYHGDSVSTLYGHLSDYRIEVNDFVQRHQVIGLVGSTGRSSGPHLHYEVRMDGRPRPYSKAIKEIVEARPLVASLLPEEIPQ